ncbi:MAG TPA: hypothetical protein VFQ07_16050 [Candidatus Polarisedimenticolia bacterium]|nr:hypothetical protein [Candidatus Polarisedimenticolia bacterium]
MVRTAREASASSLPAASAPGGIVAWLAASDAVPAPCATPLVDRLTAGETTEGTRGVLALLAHWPAEQRLVPTRDGRFAIHIQATPSGREIDPEWVARVAEALVTSRSYLSGTLGWPDPAPGPDRIQVFVTRLGAGLEGFLLPAPTGRGSRGIVLDAGLSRDRILPAVLHQAAHLSLADFGAAPEWWSEATASFLAFEGSGDREAQRTAIATRLDRAAEGLDTDVPGAMQGGLLLPLFLSERASDPSIVRQVWQAQKDLRADPLAAADAVLRRRLGIPIEQALREMAVWNLFTGRRDDGAHYPSARDLPEAPLTPVAGTVPGNAGALDPIAPTGTLVLRLPAERLRGSLAFGIEARGGRPGADLLVFYRSEGMRPVLVPVDLESGSATVAVPWTDAVEAWVVLRNQATVAEEGSTRFDVRFDLDARAPFDLAAFSATTVGRGIVLEWTTAAERGLLGWNVYRSDSPSGPFVRLNRVAIPAYGDGGADIGYLFADDAVHPGHRYYYQVEGLTALGLAERSHTASARLEPGR